MEERRGEELEEEWKAIRRGWCLVEQAFREELLAQMSGRMGEHHYAAQMDQPTVADGGLDAPEQTALGRAQGQRRL